MSIFEMWLVDLLPITDAAKELFKLVSYFFVAFFSFSLWWRNCSFTSSAHECAIVYSQMKEGLLDEQKSI